MILDFTAEWAKFHVWDKTADGTAGHWYPLVGESVHQVKDALEHYDSMTYEPGAQLPSEDASVDTWNAWMKEHDLSSLICDNDSEYGAPYTCKYRQDMFALDITRRQNDEISKVDAHYSLKLLPKDAQNMTSQEWIEWSKDKGEALNVRGNINLAHYCKYADECDITLNLNSISMYGDLPLRNITDLAISANDAVSYLVIKDDSSLHLMHNFSELTIFGVHDNGSWPVTDNATINNEGIRKIYGNVEAQYSFILTKAGTLYSCVDDTFVEYVPSHNTHPYNMTANACMTDDKCDDYSYPKYHGIRPVHTSAEGNALTNIVDVSVNKRSVCATQKTIEPTTHKVDYKLYCWGSSIFGQLGFDNHQGGYSYNEFMDAWTGSIYEPVNPMVDNHNSFVAYPKEVKFPNK